jgi:hypothetical protein
VGENDLFVRETTCLRNDLFVRETICFEGRKREDLLKALKKT